MHHNVKKHDYFTIFKSLDLKQKQQQAQQLLRDYFRMIQQLMFRQPLQQRLQQQLLLRKPLRLIVQQLLQLQEMGFEPSLKIVFSQRFYKNRLKDTTTSTTYSTTYSTTGSTTTEEQYLFTDKMPTITTKKPLKSTSAPRVTTRPTETINLITVDKEDEDDAQER